MTERRPLDRAVRAAEHVVDLLREGCDRIEVAGSIRRGSVDVKDIEIVCIPKHQPDLFGDNGFDLLNETIRRRVREKLLQWRKTTGELGGMEPDLDGRKFYTLATLESVPWPIDVFCVRPPAQWGAIMAIRTGPAEYAQRLVTSAHRQNLKCADGRLESTSLATLGVVRETHEERDFILACGLPYVAPNLRR